MEIIATEWHPVLGRDNMVLYDQIFSGTVLRHLAQELCSLG